MPDANVLISSTFNKSHASLLSPHTFLPCDLPTGRALSTGNPAPSRVTAAIALGPCRCLQAEQCLACSHTAWGKGKASSCLRCPAKEPLCYSSRAAGVLGSPANGAKVPLDYCLFF